MRRLFRPGSWSVASIRTILIVALSLAMGLGSILVGLSERDVVWIGMTRLGTQKQMLSAAVVKGMRDFFFRVDADLGFLTRSEVVVDGNETEGLRVLEEFVDRYENTPLVGFVRVDSHGKSVLLANRRRARFGEGVDVSDRDYFIWAASGHTPSSDLSYLSSPIVARGGSSLGRDVIVLARPILKEAKFDGLLFASIDIKDFVEDYIESVSVYQGSEQMVLDESGVILTAVPREEYLGKYIFDLVSWSDLRERKLQKAHFQEMLSGKNSWVQLEMLMPDGQTTRRVVGFAPLEFGGRRWVILSLLSEDEVFARMQRFEYLLRLSLLFAAVAIVIVGGLSLLGMRQAQRLWYMRGFQKAMAEVKRWRHRRMP